MGKILSGKVVYQSIKQKVLEDIKNLKSIKITPHLAIISFDARSDSQGYLKTREKLAKELGVKLTVVNYQKIPSQLELINQIIKFNKNHNIHGIIIDRPLPRGLEELKVFSTLDPKKDIDGCHPLNSGLLMQSYPGFTPNTSAAVMAILNHYKVKLSGIDATVIGRSKNVGLPMFPLLIKEDATVTICHRQTKNLSSKARNAELLIVAVGKPSFITSKFINKKTILIDIGTNYSNGQVVGDASSSVYKIVKAYTPVPGGVGPVTNIILFENLITAIKQK
jgi:methylenetetrahydrofolate dehydrogenase (NADP+) / methenyltetrahydrofolate cyclohydrolase